MKYVVGLPYRVKSFRDNLMATCKLKNVFEMICQEYSEIGKILPKDVDLIIAHAC